MYLAACDSGRFPIVAPLLKRPSHRGSCSTEAESGDGEVLAAYCMRTEFSAQHLGKSLGTLLGKGRKEDPWSLQANLTELVNF